MDPLRVLDPEKLTRRNRVVYHCLTPSAAQALVFGNGVMGGSVCTPDDSLRIQLGRGDIWNERGRMGAIAAVRIRGEQGFFTGARSVRQEGNLWEAGIVLEVETAGGSVRFSLTCLRGHDLLVVEIDDCRRKRSGFSVVLENWHEDEVVRAAGPRRLQTLHVNRTSCFSEMNARVRVDANAVGLRDPLLRRAWGLAVEVSGGTASDRAALELSAAERHEIRIATACAAPQKDGEPEEKVRVALDGLLAADSGRIREWRTAHLEYWRDFWSQSALSLHSGTGDAEYEERLWYVTLYTIAIGSGGEFPIRCFGGNFLLDQDTRDWDGGYWFQNMREVYWPLLASGHWEFMRGFFRMYFDAAPFVRAQTRSLFQKKGLCYRETQAFWGLDVNTDLPGGITTPVTHLYFSSNLECCLLMEWYWRASGDDRFLREEFYPFLREVLAFYQNYATQSEDGRYHLAPVSSLETWLNVSDDLPNLCGLHHFLPKAIGWGEEFSEDTAVLDSWRELRDHLAPIPVGRWTITSRFQMGTRSEGIHSEDLAVDSEVDPGGIFLPSAELLETPCKRHNMENAELYGIFPWGRVGIGSPPEEIRRAENTWNHRTWRYANNSWAQDAVQMARLGWTERVGEALADHASYSQRFPNGCFIGPAAPHFDGLLTSVPFLDGAGVHVTALHEMLLQSYDGILRIAPAVPGEWSGAYMLHALGGIVVEAEFVAGEPSRARISAGRDTVLRMVNGSAQPMHIGDQVLARGEIFEQTLHAGEGVVAVWPEGPVVSADLHEPRPDVIWPRYKVRPPRVVHTSGHWHDERKGHGQVGLGRDGRFPANRPV